MRYATVRCALAGVSLMLGGCAPQPARGQSTLLDSLLAANAHTFTVADGRLAGPGLEFFLRATGDAQFVALAEPHNVKEVPEIFTMMFQALHETHGYNYAALESGPVMTRMLSSGATRGDRAAAMALARRYPNGLAFVTEQEIRMIADVGGISTAAEPVWGVDQAFGGLHILERLLALAPNEEVRSRVAAMVEHARRYDGARFTESEDRYISYQARPADLAALSVWYDPSPGSEAAFLIHTLQRSNRIYRNNRLAGQGQATGYESNREREENMKELFVDAYRRAQDAGDSLPKVLLKLGHYHLYRGRFRSNVYTLGNFVSEFAKSNGMQSFSMTTQLINEPGVFWTLGDYEEYKPVADVGDAHRWTIVDLRPLRGYAHAGHLEGLHPDLEQWIFAFDAVLLIGGGSPGTFGK